LSCQPFPFADPAVVRLSHALIANEDKEHSQPIQFVGWIAVPSLTILLWIAVYFVVFGFMSKYAYGRRLLLAHPKLFTKGVFSHEGV
jgi:membrane-bound ClpP family serine protease